jgi:hypothetical protein
MVARPAGAAMRADEHAVAIIRGRLRIAVVVDVMDLDRPALDDEQIIGRVALMIQQLVLGDGPLDRGREQESPVSGVEHFQEPGIALLGYTWSL